VFIKCHLKTLFYFINIYSKGQCNKTVTASRSNTKIRRFVRVYNGNEEDLRQALDTYGYFIFVCLLSAFIVLTRFYLFVRPCVVLLDSIGTHWTNYKSGIFDGLNNGVRVCKNGMRDVNHAVVAVGIIRFLLT
jgi:hypothetical protein